MKTYTIAFGICGLLWLVSCKKEPGEPYTVSFNPYQYTLNSDYKAWVILQQEDGAILEAPRFSLNLSSQKQTFTSASVHSDQTCDVTIAVQRVSDGRLQLSTWKRISSGKTLMADIFGTGCDQRNLWARISVSGMPQMETFECVGSIGTIFQESPPPNLKLNILSLATGGTGSLLRFKEIGSASYKAYWLPMDSIQQVIQNPSHEIMLSADAFTATMPKVQLQFPFEDNWGGQILGVTKSAGVADVAYLAAFNGENELEKISALDAEVPVELPISSFWVFSSNLGAAGGLEYEMLFNTSNATLELPTVDFRLKKFNLYDNGNIYTASEGNFDVLHMLVFGNAGKISWNIEGAPDDLKICPMPDFPDSLKQQWPPFINFNLGQTRCGEYSGLENFEAFLDTDRRETLWRARLGFTGNWQKW